jgi:hypothetical protein
MQQLHGLQLNLARAKQSSESRVTNLKEVIVKKDDCINKKDECIDVLTDCITGKDNHIQVLDNQVRAIEAQVALLQLRNIFCRRRQRTKRKATGSKKNRHSTRG